MKLKQLVAGIAVMLGAGASSAAVFNDFVVDPDLVLGGSNFTADKITGNYVEVITFDAINGTFDLSLKWEAGQFVANDGADPVSNLANGGLGTNYGLYALFTASGTFSVSGATTTFTLDPGGSLEFWYDDINGDISRLTTFIQPANGTTPWGKVNGGDDILLATGTASAGSGLLNPLLPTCGPSPINPGGDGINCGSFGQTTPITLTGPGKDFFIQPSPNFYNVAFESGQLNNFDVSGTQVINGSLDVVFRGQSVPEPGSLALVGLALAAGGFMARRKVST